MADVARRGVFRPGRRGSGAGRRLARSVAGKPIGPAGGRVPGRGLCRVVGRGVAAHQGRGGLPEEVLHVQLAGVVLDRPGGDVCRKRWRSACTSARSASPVQAERAHGRLHEPSAREWLGGLLAVSGRGAHQFGEACETRISVARNWKPIASTSAISRSGSVSANWSVAVSCDGSSGSSAARSSGAKRSARSASRLARLGEGEARALIRRQVPQEPIASTTPQTAPRAVHARWPRVLPVRQVPDLRTLYRWSAARPIQAVEAAPPTRGPAPFVAGYSAPAVRSASLAN